MKSASLAGSPRALWLHAHVLLGRQIFHDRVELIAKLRVRVQRPLEREAHLDEGLDCHAKRPVSRTPHLIGRYETAPPRSWSPAALKLFP